MAMAVSPGLFGLEGTQSFPGRRATVNFRPATAPLGCMPAWEEGRVGAADAGVYDRWSRPPCGLERVADQQKIGRRSPINARNSLMLIWVISCMRIRRAAPTTILR